MKKIGLLGGMTWGSTIEYYRLLNEETRNRLGGLHSCKILLDSVDFAEFREHISKDDWVSVGTKLAQAGLNVEAGGADMVLIGANTMHRVADTVQGALEIPVIHIADAIAAKANELNVKKLGLLGTAFTMEQDFISKPLADKYDLEIITPNEDDRSVVHNSIFDEFAHGKFLDSTRNEYLRVIAALKESGAEAVVLGCTEIGLLLKSTECGVPLIDTVQAHVDAALDKAIV